MSGGDDRSLLRREKMADHFEPAGTESLETVAGIQPVDDGQNMPVFTEEYVSASCQSQVGEFVLEHGRLFM